MKNKTLDISQNYDFCLGEWREADVQSVCLPHAVELSPANSSGCRNYQGLCTYKKRIFIPEEYTGKKIRLEFEGAMGSAYLDINGVRIAENRCGYIPFVVDVEKYFVCGEENLITVTLDNSDDPSYPVGKPQRDLDFTYEGGLYRKASMEVFEPLYITHPLVEDEVAGGGIFVYYTNVSAESAQVNAKIHIRNEYPSQKDFTLALSLLDEQGAEVGSRLMDGVLASMDAAYLESCITVDAPHLWQINSPYLYTLRCTLLCGGEEVYTRDVEIGIRTFRFTISDGVIFNGVSHRFNGANYHQTWPYIGNAVPDSLLLRDMMMLKEAGFENIRSHYPLSHTVTEACARLGMTLIVSNPGWQFFRSGDFFEHAKMNMRRIIRSQRNCPAVILWEPMLNESNMGYERQLELHRLVHEEYPYADCYTASDYGPTDVAFQDYVPGMIGYEEYGFLEKKDPKPMPIWTREYGDDPDNFHDQNTIWRLPRGFGDFPMVEAVNRMIKKYQNSESESVMYIDVLNNKNRCGYGIWPAISHNRGYHINPCYGGHLDLFRVPKFSYYFMKSQQDREIAGDVLFVASYWSDASPDDVTVYSNAERVALFCDGVLVGERTPDDVELRHPPFTFPNVRRRYKAKNRSRLRACAYVGEQMVAECELCSPGVPERIELRAELMGIPLKADGADIVAIRCYMLDAEGTVVPMMGDGHPILFEVEGEGCIVGDDSIGANPICPEGGVATVLLRSTCTAGEIKVKARLRWEQGRGEKIPCSVSGDELILFSVDA